MTYAHPYHYPLSHYHSRPHHHVDGMLFHRPALLLGDLLDRLHLTILRKPLFECLICMGGVYTLVLYPLLYGWSWAILPTMLGVIGLNTLISALTCHLHE